MLQKNAKVSFPYYKDEKNPYIVIVLQSTIPNQSVKININDKDVFESGFRNNSMFLVYQLKDFDKHEIEINFEFEKEDIKAFGWKNKILGRKVKYSGAYTMCDVYSRDELKKCFID